MLMSPQQLVTTDQARSFSLCAIKECQLDVGWLISIAFLDRQILGSNYFHFQRVEIVPIKILQKRLIGCDPNREMIYSQSSYDVRLEIKFSRTVGRQ